MLVGKSAEDNDLLSLRLGEPHDFWFHLAGDSGSHVVVRNPERLERLPVVPWSRPDLRVEWIRVTVEEITGRRIAPTAA